MSTKIILSLVVIAAVSAIAVGGTVAYFSDTETSTGNTFTAGTLDLNVDGGNINVVKFTVANTVPGASGTGTYTLNNVGSVNGYIDLESISVVDDDVSCTDPEADVEGAGCGGTGAGTGELGANINVDLFIDANNNGIFDGGDTTIFTGSTLSAIASNYPLNLPLNAGATTYITLNWNIPTGAGNIIQSDSTTLDMSFELGQTTGQ